MRQGSLAMPPAKKLAFVVCMDARIDPIAAFGLKEGDAHVIRNAGGRVVEAVRSLVISQELLGTREIVVVHHTYVPRSSRVFSFMLAATTRAVRVAKAETTHHPLVSKTPTNALPPQRLRHAHLHLLPRRLPREIPNRHRSPRYNRRDRLPGILRRGRICQAGRGVLKSSSVVD